MDTATDELGATSVGDTAPAVNGVNGHRGDGSDDVEMRDELGEDDEMAGQEFQTPEPSMSEAHEPATIPSAASTITESTGPTVPPPTIKEEPLASATMAGPATAAGAAATASSAAAAAMSSPARASTPLAGLAMKDVYEHGSPTRVYLNTRVGPVLLEGLKFMAKHEPERPLRWLSDFLAARSRDLEGE